MIEFDWDQRELAALPIPTDIHETDIDELRRNWFRVWIRGRVNGKDLFAKRHVNSGLAPRVHVQLLDFALTFAGTIEDVVKSGKATLDPWEYGAFIELTLAGNSIVVYSKSTNITDRVEVVSAVSSVRILNDSVRAILLGLSPHFVTHPQLGRWARGEFESINYESL